MKRVTTCVPVCKRKESLPFYSSRAEPYRGDLFFYRYVGDPFPRFGVALSTQSVGLCVAVLLVWHIVSLIHHKGLCSESSANTFCGSAWRVP
jgi:hypothetical protein